jgi:tetratricopeptide (TPR) repeat protein
VNQREVEQSAAYFEAALTVNPEATRAYGWHHAFLFAIGDSDKALPLAKASAERAPHDPDAQAIYALWLYGLRRFGESASRLTQAIRLDPSNRLALLCSALIDLSSERSKNAFRNIKAFQVPFDHARWSCPGIEQVCMRAIEGPLTGPFNLLTGARFPRAIERERILGADIDCPEEQIELAARNFAPHPSDHEDVDEPFLAASFDGDPEDEIFDPPVFEHRGSTVTCYVPSLSLNAVLSSMADLRFEQALSFLQTAWVHDDPFVLWLHLMPIFDPILETREFQSLLKRRLDPVPTDE